ncbi:hypothetical protein ONE63_004428 [Megalurothrips usitatus]|uniref:E3 ubiquitin-protein ligase APD1-4 middle domain-containing protein n=1 Tax=Megalurothrips usitatus TaxID=439358 RepID=A0AAV7X5X1_9NEOP|nr:hypothetical protein ONE63_004428 [Megalurothrips usitatus]
MAVNLEVEQGDNLLSNSHVVYYHSYMYKSMLNIVGPERMQGPRRVVAFCVFIGLLPPALLVFSLYLRQAVFADVSVAVAESDVLRIVDGISTVFCQEHRLKMNSSFNAFQMKGNPEISSIRKHIRLKKSMSLPDDTLEYWGFYLPKGSSVNLTVCSRFEGSRILVVQGERNLNTCGLLDHTAAKAGIHMAESVGQVRVTFEADAMEIYSDSTEHVRQTAAQHANSQDNNVGHEVDDDGDEAAATTGGPKRVRRTMPKDVHLPDPKDQLDGAPVFGGNANTSDKSSGSSVSSFENGLLTCYDGQILLQQDFPPSHLCTDVHSLEKGGHMQTAHEVTADGYYYYIFYSDNDFVLNDIHAVFNIYKPTYRYTNYTKGCLNKTECRFPLKFLSTETVIVEVPTRDGIEHEQDDFSLLISSCQPRRTVYAIFPVTVLIIILACAFL